tara:strand:+ start:348 stop:536 length:189 start_codon:yes stop_codon:yes gene_type:complete
MTKLNGTELKGNETFDELLRIGKKKKDNSKKGDIFFNCRSCGVRIRPDWYSLKDKRYCLDCL